MTAQTLPPDQGKRWEAWADFCDKAEVAPDTHLTPEKLARRFNEKTRGMTTSEWVRKIMPENADA